MRSVLQLVFVLFIVSVPSLSKAAEPLGEQLRATGWTRLIGTWVDENTGGQAMKTTFSWRMHDHVIENLTESNDNQTIALIAVNATSEETFHIAADNEGGTSKGEWTWNADAAELQIKGISADAAETNLKITLKPVDDSTLEVFVNDQSEPSLTLVRQDLN